ncbi:MAG: thrombospondin type 3 repeat-containing protein, partial [Verrucomicrobiae bacterium]|nr:thrombospondin type 3 repeat-containing protein [Verrucomicrobiae bacterium]
QIIHVGPNGVPDWPNPDGSPGGDDTLYRTTVIGQGMDLNLNDTGRFSTSFYPPPSGRIYARVFDGPDLTSAQYYGQSATFLRQNVEIFDVSALGLLATWHRIGSLPHADDDGDGQSNLAELTANTNPNNHADLLAISDFLNESQIALPARPGRRYILERTTDDLAGTVTWTPIVELGPLPAPQNIILADPNPPNTPKAFYRVRVVLP